MAKSPHHINTWEHLERIQSSIENNENRYFSALSQTWEAHLKQQFQYVDEENGSIHHFGLDINPIRSESKNALASQNPMASLSSYIRTGFYPPPELLILLAEIFDYYFDKKGSVSLEHILFGHVKSGVGNFSARQRSDKTYQRFSMCLIMSGLESKSKETKQLSQKEVAQKFLDGEFGFLTEKSDRDVESFLKSWRKWEQKRRED